MWPWQVQISGLIVGSWAHTLIVGSTPSPSQGMYRTQSVDVSLTSIFFSFSLSFPLPLSSFTSFSSFLPPSLPPMLSKNQW